MPPFPSGPPSALALALRQENENLRATVRALRTMLAHLPDVMVAVYTYDGVLMLMAGLQDVNVNAREGQHYDAFLPAERREKFLYVFTRAQHGHTTVSEYPIGETLYELTCKPIQDDRLQIAHIMIQVRDITASRKALDAAQRRAVMDSMTGLNTRSVLQARIDALVAAGQPFAVLMLDLDGFKQVNDTKGHSAGDAALKAVGAAILSSTRQGDLGVRMGGDEFVVVLPRIDRPHLTAARIRGKVADVCAAHDCGVSVGLALYPQHGLTAVELLHAADTAMYSAKAAKDGTVHLPPPASDRGHPG